MTSFQKCQDSCLILVLVLFCTEFNDFMYNIVVSPPGIVFFCTSVEHTAIHVTGLKNNMDLSQVHGVYLKEQLNSLERSQWMRNYL